MLLEMFTHSGVLAKMGILIAFAPVVAATLYAIKPSERRLSFFARSHWPHCSQGSRRSRRGSSPSVEGCATGSTSLSIGASSSLASWRPSWRCSCLRLPHDHLAARRPRHAPRELAHIFGHHRPTCSRYVS